MNINCRDRERIFADGTPEEWRALELHAEGCEECAPELHAWMGLSVAAQELRGEWNSPNLWPAISRGLAEQQKKKVSIFQRWAETWKSQSLSWQTAAAVFVLVALTVFVSWFAFHQSTGSTLANQALLRDSAVAEAEHAEAAYVRAIDKLASEAQPQLANPASPLMAGYREKLLVLDSAIAELRTQADQNPANAHLRRELLALYQDKQDTLEQVLEGRK
jgi:hypothetical protein